MKRLFLLLAFIPVFAFAESMYSPKWGFFIDLPEGYEYVAGDAKDRFSFMGPEEIMFDLVIYDRRFNSIQALVDDVNTRLSNRGDFDFFEYNGKQAAIIKLEFANYDGWAIISEIAPQPDSGVPPLLLALAYGDASRIDEFGLFHLSALDSICPTLADRYYPGIITEYSYPRGEAKNTPLVVDGLSAMINENDAVIAQIVIEREFAILTAYLNTSYLQDAYTRYYRFIFRDSFDRIFNAVDAITFHFGGYLRLSDEQQREYAQKALTFVQGFRYERDLSGSDFINLVTAVTEGRGDCDSRSMLFAAILGHANIPSAIMISTHYSHAMGLADIAGTGARFNSAGTQWLVAETTANIDIGLIDQTQSDPRFWFAVLFLQ